MRETTQIASVNLPVPPSVNKAFEARRGSHRTMKSAAYRFWLRQVLEEHGRGQYLPVLVPGKYGFWLDLPPAMRGDIDNRVKLVSDVLKQPEKTSPDALGIVVDDGLMKGLHIEFADGLPADRCVVTVVALAIWPSYVCMRLEP
jgi:Holliday junction resolvase RusA-like endonuclease